MYIPFDQLPDTARVWIYTSNRILTLGEQSTISDRLVLFSRNWQSHQKDVVASFILLKDRFIVLAADDAHHDVSGCGIDKSVHEIVALENELQISLTDKTTIYFDKEGEIFSVPLPKIKAAVTSNQIDTHTYLYNTLISNKKELETSFFSLAIKAWTSRYFSPVIS